MEARPGPNRDEGVGGVAGAGVLRSRLREDDAPAQSANGDVLIRRLGAVSQPNCMPAVAAARHDSSEDSCSEAFAGLLPILILVANFLPMNYQQIIQPQVHIPASMEEP